jgi:hypothetical protein
VTTTGKRKHRKQHIRCTLIGMASRDVKRRDHAGRRTYAVGSAVVGEDRTALVMRSVRAMTHGRYRVTIVELSGSTPTVTRFELRL